MRILFCSDALTVDGVTSYILNTGAALKRAGHEVAVLGRWAGKGFQSRYRHEGFTVITCPSISAGNMYFDMRAKAFAPDVIMTDPRRSFPLATRIKAITHAPVITYFLDPVEKTDRPGRDIASLVKHSNVFTAFEPDILSELHGLNSGVPAVKMVRPLDVFFSPSELPQREGFNILCFGRLSGYKTPGLLHMLDNIKPIQEHIPGFVINIVGGGGWRLFKLKLLARNLNASLGRECVRITGTQTDPRKYIESANVVLASATSAMESAYSMRPVVAVCSGYFGRVKSENLNEAVKCYFSERYGKNDFAELLPEIFKIYDSYYDESFRDDLREVSRRLCDDFSERETLRGFNEIISAIQITQ
ncbi:MAG: glycosyltransferase [Synergistaceae bacterium]|nr:glycosyltransferase [Synergistaceae bacterium]